MRNSMQRVAAMLSLCAAIAQPCSGQAIKVTLLGTGGPPPSLARFGPSTLVEAGGQRFLFDAGRGALQRLAQIKMPWQNIDALFLTHLHSDHLVGLPDLWLTGWLVGPGRNRPLRIYGPEGTVALMSHLEQAFQFDIAVRMSDDHASQQGRRYVAENIAEGIIHDSAGVKITAFLVDHGPVAPAFGYRIDYAGRSLVLSGDTRVSENLVRHAQGVDVLIHEVAFPESFVREGVSAARTKSVLAHHVTPEEAASVFTRTKPRLAVYSHIIQPSTSDDELLAATRSGYSGRVEVGEDLMVIMIDTSIVVRRPGPKSK